MVNSVIAALTNIMAMIFPMHCCVLLLKSIQKKKYMRLLEIQVLYYLLKKT